jgi:hypothetical protein
VTVIAHHVPPLAADTRTPVECGSLDKLEVGADAHERTRVARKVDDVARTEDGVDGAAFKPELPQVGT